MPVFIAKYNEPRQDDPTSSLEGQALLGTIRVPRNLSLLTDRLPKANYETEKKSSSIYDIQEEEPYHRQVGTASKHDDGHGPQRMKRHLGKPPLQAMKQPSETS